MEWPWPEGPVNKVAGSNVNISWVGVTGGDSKVEDLGAKKLAVVGHVLTLEYQRWQGTAGQRPPSLHSLKPGGKHIWWELQARKFGFGNDKILF